MCFSNYIAIKGGCSEQTLADGGLYLNTLGISREFIEGILNEDYEDVDDFLSDKIALASDVLKNDIYKFFTPKFNVKSIITGDRIGQYYENPTIVPAISGSSKGLQIRLWNDTTFAKIYVSKIRTFFDYTGTVTFTIWDLNQNAQIGTFDVNSVAGEIVETEINRVFKSDVYDLNIVFLYDASTFASYASSIDGYGCVSCYRGSAYRQNRFVYATGITIPNADDKVQANLNGNSDTGGVSILYSLECNHDAWICQNAHFFASAMLYKTAHLIAEYALLVTDGFSKQNIDRDILRERLDVYFDGYMKRLDAGVKNLKIPSSNVCFECNRLRMNATVLPA